jgi:hypothetical protein
MDPYNLFEAGVDSLFGFLCISLILITLWAVARFLTPRSQHHNSPIILCLIGFVSTPVLLVLVLVYDGEKKEYIAKQSLIADAKQAQLCSAATEKIIRRPKNASAIWVKQGGRSSNLFDGPADLLAQHIFYSMQRDMAPSDEGRVSVKREDLPANVLEVVVTPPEKLQKIGFDTDVYPLSVHIYEEGELIAQRRDYWRSRGYGCDDEYYPRQDLKSGYAAFFYRVFNMPAEMK